MVAVTACSDCTVVFQLPHCVWLFTTCGLQQVRPPCPSPSPEVFPILCPLHQWCHSAISSSDALFSSCPQSFPASGTFPMSCLVISGDQNTGASASVLPTSIHGWFLLKLTGLCGTVVFYCWKENLYVDLCSFNFCCSQLSCIPKGNENRNWRDVCTPIFIVTLFTIAKIQKQPACSSVDEWIKKL